MKVCIVIILALLSQLVAHSQSIEVLWQRQLEPNEKFLAISPDNLFIVIQSKNDIGNNIIYTEYIIGDQKNDTVSIEKIVSADISKTGRFIIIASETKKWYYLSADSLRILNSGFQKFETGEYHQGTIVKFSDTSESKGFLLTGSTVSNPVGHSTKGGAYYYNWMTGVVLRQISSAIPYSLSVLPFDEGAISLVNSSFVDDPLGQIGTSGSRTYTTIWRIKNGGKEYKELDSLNIQSQQCDSGQYVINTADIIDITNYNTRSIFPRMNSNFIVLGQSKYTIEYTDSPDFPFCLRSIVDVGTKKPLKAQYYKCQKLFPCKLPNFFLSVSNDNVLRLSQVYFKDTSSLIGINVSFRPSSISIRENDNVNFINTSFPINRNHRFLWDFGDGSTSTERDPVHQYTMSGKYTVRLIVSSPNGVIDSVTKHNAIYVVSMDTNIIRSKRIWNKKFFSIEYSPNGEELVCMDTMNSFIIQSDDFSKLDSNINDLHGLHIIGDTKSQQYLTIHKGARTPQNFTCPLGGSEIIFYVRVRESPKNKLVDSFIISNLTCDPNFSTVYERFKSARINDSIIGFTYEKKEMAYSGFPPRPYYFQPGAVKFFNSNNFNEKRNFNAETFDGCRPNNTQYLQGNYILTEKGIQDFVSKKMISSLNLKGVNDFAIVDENIFLATTKDFATPIILFNINGDTLHLFRSTLRQQTCIAVNPLNKYEFATADDQGRVTIWKIPQFSPLTIKPIYIDFTSNRKDNTLDSITFISYIFPASKQARIEWNFGDGSSSNERNPKHFYSKTGAYTVSLRYVVPQLIDTTITKIEYIRIRLKPDSIDFSTPDTVVNKSSSVYFTNLTKSVEKFSYLWNFGDGTVSSETNPRHLYSQYGTYSVSLTVKRPGYSDTTITKENLIVVRPILKVTWLRVPRSVNFGEPVVFEIDVEPKDIGTQIVWEFDKGHKVYTPKATYTYPVTGVTATDLATKNIRLTVTLDSLYYSTSKSVVIGPNVKIFPSYSELTVNGRWSSHTTILPKNGDYIFEWSWGDGSKSSTGIDAKHIYDHEGIYRIIFRVYERITGTYAEDTSIVAVLPSTGKLLIAPSVSNYTPITFKWYGTAGSISIHSLSGELVRLFHYSGATSAHEYVWNTDDHNGNRVPPGLYYCTLKDSYGATLSKPLFILY